MDFTRSSTWVIYNIMREFMALKILMQHGKAPCFSRTGDNISVWTGTAIIMIYKGRSGCRIIATMCNKRNALQVKHELFLIPIGLPGSFKKHLAIS